jgi:hypothetical protein
MESVDLNIDNYDLRDLIGLFQIPFHFTETHLKEAKKTVLKTHPDKSRLDKKFFLFFSKAYKYLLKIFQLRKGSNITNTEYDNQDTWEEENKILINNKISNLSQSEYNKWFNDAFNNMKVKDEDEETGYGEWLKSEDGYIGKEAKSVSEMNEMINNKKRDLRGLVVYNEFNDTIQGNHFNLLRDQPENYGSSLFDKLQFEDVKKAHTESVVPVTHEDYINKTKYNSVDELNRDRTTTMLDSTKHLANHNQQLSSNKQNEESENINRAYKLMKQDEQITSSYNKFWSDLKKLGM